jgi:hypothetical protein
MAINETRAVSVTFEGGPVAPVFLPLLDLAPGNILIPNQSNLTISGVPGPLDVAVMLCAPGTLVGDPGEAVLQAGEPFSVEVGKVFVLEGNVPPLAQGGVLGLYVPTQTMPPDAKVEGVLSIVR